MQLVLAINGSYPSGSEYTPPTEPTGPKPDWLGLTWGSVNGVSYGTIFIVILLSFICYCIVFILALTCKSRQLDKKLARQQRGEPTELVPHDEELENVGSYD